jgi:hypothetical protein
MIQKILVPTDGSKHAEKATEYALDIAAKYNAKLYLMHVVSKPKVPEGFMEFLRDEHVAESPAYVYLQTMGKRILGKATDPFTSLMGSDIWKGKRTRDEEVRRWDTEIPHEKTLGSCLQSTTRVTA